MGDVRESSLPRTALRPRKDAIGEALATIQPSQLVVYHHGRLLVDRRRSREVNLIANHAMHMAGRDKVHLLQFRDGSDGFYYVAVGKDRPSNNRYGR